MPAYHIDVSFDRDRWKALSDFEKGYIEAAFWLLDEEIGDRPFSDLSPEGLDQARADCADFLASLPRDSHGRSTLDLAIEYAPDTYDERRAGIDFFLTRNHHGAGFWDRGLGPLGDKLTEHAHPYGEANLYLGDDNQLYF